jgi:hypothetical protein
MTVRWRCPKCKKVGTTPLDQPAAWCLKCFTRLERRDTLSPRGDNSRQPRLLPAIAPIAEDDTLTVDELLRLPDDEDDRKLPDEDEVTS